MFLVNKYNLFSVLSEVNISNNQVKKGRLLTLKQEYNDKLDQ